MYKDSTRISREILPKTPFPPWTHPSQGPGKVMRDVDPEPVYSSMIFGNHAIGHYNTRTPSRLDKGKKRRSQQGSAQREGRKTQETNTSDK